MRCGRADWIRSRSVQGRGWRRVWAGLCCCSCSRDPIYQLLLLLQQRQLQQLKRRLCSAGTCVTRRHQEKAAQGLCLEWLLLWERAVLECWCGGRCFSCGQQPHQGWTLYPPLLLPSLW